MLPARYDLLCLCVKVCGLNTLSQNDKEFVEQLRTDMEGLLLELDNLNRRNDELMTAKDSDLSVIRDLDLQLKEYKRKYEQAKTELRSVKGDLFANFIAPCNADCLTQPLPKSSFQHPSLKSLMISYQCRQMVVFLTFTSRHSFLPSTVS